MQSGLGELMDEQQRHMLEKAVQELYYWQYAGSTCFSARLYELMMKADGPNLAALAMAFPVECTVMRMWLAADDCGRQLFRDFGFEV